jgi:NADPH2:quinone reductase
MRAARLHEIGGNLRIDTVEEPEPGPGEVVVDVAYASVNPLDIWITRGAPGAAAANLPWVPGTEGAGHVDGRPVLVSGGGVGLVRHGLYRERAAVPSDAVTELDHDVDLAQAAALGVVGVTAWSSLRDRAHLHDDDRVLVLGASGGVGSMAVQLAHAAGVVVWGQTTSAGKEAAMRDAGADVVVVADAAGLVAAVAELQPTVILDGLGGAYTVAVVEAAAPLGRIVVYGTSSNVESTLNLRVMYRKGVSLLGYSGLILAEDRRRQILDDLLGEVAAGRLKVPVEVVPLAQAADCHRRVLDRALTGKLVLDTRA